ncbi:MAG: hypothetical protein S4CHLAM27_00990 [Chlamydiia bacterium]|nr:hypothetical protein [Chlamydiia bacterium]
MIDGFASNSTYMDPSLMDSEPDQTGQGPALHGKDMVPYSDVFRGYVRSGQELMDSTTDTSGAMSFVVHNPIITSVVLLTIVLAGAVLFYKKKIDGAPIQNTLASPDPYGYRATLDRPLRVSGLPKPNDHDGVKNYINRHDLASGTQKIYQKWNDLPGMIHFIWLGSQVPAVYHKRVELAKEQFPDYEVIVWTDGNSCFDSKQEIRHMNVFDSLPNDFWRGMKDYFLLQLSKVAPNYGEAAFLLKPLLLYSFGGISCEIDKSIDMLDLSRKEELTRLPCGFKVPAIRTLDTVCAAPKNKMVQYVIDCQKQSYTKTNDQLYNEHLLPHLKPAYPFFKYYSDERMTTLCRSGRYLHFLRQYLKKTRLSGNFRLPCDVRMLGRPSDYSWLRPIKPLGRAATVLDRNRITAEMIWDLQSNPSFLNLAKFEWWLMDIYSSAEEKSKANFPLLVEILNDIEKKYPDIFSSIKIAFIGTENLRKIIKDKFSGKDIIYKTMEDLSQEGKDFSIGPVTVRAFYYYGEGESELLKRQQSRADEMGFTADLLRSEARFSESPLGDSEKRTVL